MEACAYSNEERALSPATPYMHVTTLSYTRLVTNKKYEIVVTRLLLEYSYQRDITTLGIPS